MDGLTVPAILLIRHAQASFGATDYDVLSELGARQAAAVHATVGRRAGAGARLLSGSLRRQFDTARPWTAGGAEVHVDPRWDEYDSADILSAHSNTGAALERRAGDDEAAFDSRAFQHVLDAALRDWIAAGAGGPAAEPWPAFRERTAAAVADLAASLGKGETAVVFTSGGVIAACCVLALGLADVSFVTFNHVAVNGAVTKLVSGRRGTTLISFNEHAHLEPDGLVTYR